MDKCILVSHTRIKSSEQEINALNLKSETHIKSEINALTQFLERNHLEKQPRFSPLQQGNVPHV